MTPSLPEDAAFWFLLTAGPVALLVIWDDLANLKIRNKTVIVTAAIYVLVGVIVLPWQTVAFQTLVGCLVLILTFALFSVSIMGGGDAKYIAAIAPYFFWSDWAIIIVLFCGITLGTLLMHRLARRLGAAQLAPCWDSWTSGKRFPLGLPLGLILITYLVLAAFPA